MDINHRSRQSAIGRLTPSFRTVYAEVLQDLRREMQGCFVDLSHKTAFDLLLKEAWGPEEAAMGTTDELSP